MLRTFDFAEQLWVVKGENNTQPCEAELSVDLASLEENPHDWSQAGPTKSVTMTMRLPSNRTLDEMNSVSEWCVAARHNFGDGTFRAP